MSWAVGSGYRSWVVDSWVWVWVNVVGKKKYRKNDKVK